jgi:ABC-2 type transport system permease protein
VRRSIALLAMAHLRLLLRDGRLPVAVALTVLWVSLATAVTGSQVESTRQAAASAQQQVRQTWLDQGRANPHSAAHFGSYVFLVPDPLAALDPGLTRALGGAVFLEAHRQNGLLGTRARDATVLDRMGALSPSAVLLLWGSLCALVLTHDLFAARSDAEDRMMAVSGASRLARVSGPALAAGLALLGVLGLGIVLAVCIGGLFVPELGGAWDRVGLWAAVLLAHGLVWGALGAALSATGSRAATAVAAAGVWLWGTGLLPRLAASLADEQVALPTAGGFAVDLERALEAGPDGHHPSGERVEQERQRLLARHGVSSVEELPLNFDAVSMQIAEEAAHPVFDAHFGSLYAAASDQLARHRLAGALSPLVLAAHASMGVAGTGLEAHRRFVEAGEQHRRDLVARMNDALAQGSRTGDWDYEVGREVWQAVPDYRPPPPAPQLDGPALAGLGAWLLAGSVLATAAGSRRVRR